MAKRREWYGKNKDKVIVKTAKRRELLRSLGGATVNKHRDFSPAVLTFLMEKQRGRCAVCRCSLKKSGRHLDHVVPLVAGGGNDKGNLQFLCPPCNLSKGAKDPIEFMQRRGFLL